MMTGKRQFDGERVKLGEVCAVNPRQPRFLNDGDEVTFIPLAAVNTNGTMGSGTSAVRSEVRKGHPWFQEGDILLAKITPSFENGKIAIADCSSNDGYASTEFHVIRPNLDVIDGRYLLSYLRTAKVRQYCAARMKGSAGQRRVPIEVLKALPVPVASMAAQKCIADVLSRINLAIGTRRNVLFQLDTLVKSRFVEMFGDPVLNEMQWPISTIKETAIVYGDGPFGSNLKSADYVDDGVRVIRLGNIQQGHFSKKDRSFVSWEKFESLKRYECRPGEVVIATLGDPVLRACLVPNFGVPSIHKADCMYYEVDKERLIPVFAMCAINHPSMLRRATVDVHGQTRGRINSTQTGGLPMILPSLPLQQQFADFVAKVDKPRFVGLDGLCRLPLRLSSHAMLLCQAAATSLLAAFCAQATPSASLRLAASHAARSRARGAKTFAGLPEGENPAKLEPAVLLLLPCTGPFDEQLPSHKAAQRGRPGTRGGNHEQRDLEQGS